MQKISAVITALLTGIVLFFGFAVMLSSLSISCLTPAPVPSYCIDHGLAVWAMNVIRLVSVLIGTLVAMFIYKRFLGREFSTLEKVCGVISTILIIILLVLFFTVIMSGKSVFPF